MVTLGPPLPPKCVPAPWNASARRPCTAFVEMSEGDVRPPFAPQIRPAALGHFFGLCQESLYIFCKDVTR